MTNTQQELLNALALAWQNHPKLRLGQLIEVARLSCQEHRARSCNSSKGNKDFIEWLTSKGWKLEQMPLDILCMYSRLNYQLYQATNALDAPAPTFLVDVIRSAIAGFNQRERNAILKSCGF